MAAALSTVLCALVVLLTPSSAEGASELGVWGALLPGQSLTQTGLCYGRWGAPLALMYQGDGNFVLYRSGVAIWWTPTYGTAAGEAVLQSDGNFVIYTPAHVPVWHTQTSGMGSPGYRFVLQADENIVLVDGADTPLWSSGTSCGYYEGCFAEAADRALPVQKTLGSNTVEACRTACADSLYPYAGLQFGSQCWCGTDYSKHGAVSESQCSMSCTGNPAQKCGAAWKNSVYSTGGACTKPSCSGGADEWADYAKCMGAPCHGFQQGSTYGHWTAHFTSSDMAGCYAWFKGQVAACTTPENRMGILYISTSHRQCSYCSYGGNWLPGPWPATPRLHVTKAPECGRFRYAVDATPNVPWGEDCDCSKVTDISYFPC